MTLPVDSSSFARTLTLRNGADLVLSPAQFGAASLRCSGTGGTASIGYGYTVPSSTDFTFAASTQWTFECWVYFLTAPTSAGFITRWSTDAQAQWALYLSSGTLRCRFYDSTNTIRDTDAAWAPSATTWYHVAVDRDGSNNVRTYVDGTVKATQSYSQAMRSSTNAVAVGYVGGFADTLQMSGYIDEVRISNTARYAGAFTPSASAFTSDASTLLLTHLDETATARVSHGVVEVLRTGTAVNARVSQTALEVLRTGTAINARVSQALIEVLRENETEVPITSSSAQQIVVAT